MGGGTSQDNGCDTTRLSLSILLYGSIYQKKTGPLYSMFLVYVVLDTCIYIYICVFF